MEARRAGSARPDACGSTGRPGPTAASGAAWPLPDALPVWPALTWPAPPGPLPPPPLPPPRRTDPAARRHAGVEGTAQPDAPGAALHLQLAQVAGAEARDERRQHLVGESVDRLAVAPGRALAVQAVLVAHLDLLPQRGLIGLVRGLRPKRRRLGSAQGDPADLEERAEALGDPRPLGARRPRPLRGGEGAHRPG